jgi:glutamyl-tRNA synthetase
MAENIRVRIAPSPTGKFHVGTARTALFNYLFAKKYGGTFIVRIEDTDKERSDDLYTRDILDGLLWLGMEWDEGPETGGAFGPYFQQERLTIYQQFIDQLLEQGNAYRCYCTPEDLEAERELQQRNNESPKYSGKCQNLSRAQIDQYEREGRSSAIRFKVEPKSVVIKDIIRGDVEFDTSTMTDFVIVRSDGMPLFILTNAVDDNMMEISHVFRGEDHLSNTAKQVLIGEALNFLSPQFGHFPLILNADRSKMSKRKNPVSITDDFKTNGFLPDALVNFLALLGWSSGTDREIYSMKELIDEFQIERVGKSPSIFDQEKLLWMNGYYVRHMQVGHFASEAQNFITNKEIFQKSLDDPDFYIQVAALVQERTKRLDEIEKLIEFFYIKPDYKADLLIARKSTKERTLTALKAADAVLKELKSLTLDEVEIALRNKAKESELKDGELLWAVRVALSGLDASPGTFELIEVFGKEEVEARLATAIRKLSALKD